jgi:hypothetical protein
MYSLIITAVATGSSEVVAGWLVRERALAARAVFVFLRLHGRGEARGDLGLLGEAPAGALAAQQYLVGSD